MEHISDMIPQARTHIFWGISSVSPKPTCGEYIETHYSSTLAMQHAGAAPTTVNHLAV
jgi:hypothetical protein